MKSPMPCGTPGAAFEAEAAHGALAVALDLPGEDDCGNRGVSTIAALMLWNACLLQRRLREEPGMRRDNCYWKRLRRLNALTSSGDRANHSLFVFLSANLL